MKIIEQLHILQRTRFNMKILRDAWISWLTKVFPGRYHLTIKFPHGTSETICRELLNTFMMQLNRKIYGKRYKEGTSYIEGVAVTEYVWMETTYHYHILIKTSPFTDDFNRMNTFIAKLVELSARKDSKRFILEYNLVDYYLSTLEDYLSKDFWKRIYASGKSPGDTIGVFGDADVIFGDIPNKLKVDYHPYKSAGSWLHRFSEE